MITGDTGGQIVTGLQAGLNGLGGLGRRRSIFSCEPKIV